MQLATYIKDLLYRYECVIVPGFGAFLAHSRSAFIADENLFYPPARTLTFNRQLQTNDGLLANHVASCEGCSYETALQQIRFFTRSLSLSLDSERRLTLEGIGDFELDSENSLVFAPSAHNFDSGSFGLSSFGASLIDRTPEKVLETAADEIRPLNTKTSRPYLKYAAIGLLAVAVSGLGGLGIYRDQVDNHNFAERQKASEQLEQQIQQATFILDDPLPAIEVSVPERKGKYHIIAGAYRIEDNADTKWHELRQKGYAANKLGVNRFGLHCIAYSSHADRGEALKALSQVKASDNPDAWLLVKDLDNE